MRARFPFTGTILQTLGLEEEFQGFGALEETGFDWFQKGHGRFQAQELGAGVGGSLSPPRPPAEEFGIVDPQALKRDGLFGF